MRKLKGFVTASAAIGIAAAGLTMLATPAQAIYCLPNEIPAGYWPTGVSCSRGCDSDLHVNNRGSRFCAIYGPGLPGF
jgi:hypothetical protein